MNCRKYFISGRVQGVFFRQSTVTEGKRLGLTGYAMNLPDGRVEVVACGDDSALDKLHSWLQYGPDLARVDKMEASDVSIETHFTSFSVR